MYISVSSIKTVPLFLVTKSLKTKNIYHFTYILVQHWPAEPLCKVWFTVVVVKLGTVSMFMQKGWFTLDYRLVTETQYLSHKLDKYRSAYYTEDSNMQKYFVCACFTMQRYKREENQTYLPGIKLFFRFRDTWSGFITVPRSKRREHTEPGPLFVL